ncbi:hypothetical protein T265_13330, partial [Opisthorchis viverrini]
MKETTHKFAENSSIAPYSVLFLLQILNSAGGSSPPGSTEGSTKAEILPGFPSLGKTSRDMERFIRTQPTSTHGKTKDDLVLEGAVLTKYCLCTRHWKPTTAFFIGLQATFDPMNRCTPEELDISFVKRVFHQMLRSFVLSFSCHTHPMPSSHVTRRKNEGWDTVRLPKPRQANSRGRGRVRTPDLPFSKFSTFLLTHLTFSHGSIVVRMVALFVSYLI